MEQIFPKDETEKEAKKEVEKEIKLPFEDASSDDIDSDTDMISADEFYENRIRNESIVRVHLLELAKRLTKKAIKNSYDNEVAYDTIGDMKKIRVVVTLCQYGHFYEDEDLSSYGEYDIWYNLISNGMFPIKEFKEWLQSFGWQLDCHSDDCRKDEIWLDLVSRPFI